MNCQLRSEIVLVPKLCVGTRTKARTNTRKANPMRIITTMCVALLIAALPLQARDEIPAELARYLDDQAIAIAKIDLTKLDLKAAFQRIAPLTGDEWLNNEIKPLAVSTTAALKEAGARVIYVVANFNDPFIF